MIESSALIAIISTFLLAGMVKGIIGLGLPTVSLALLTIVFDLPTAMALLIVPSLITNIWQAASGGNGWQLIKRLRWFLLMAAVTVWIGALGLSRIDLASLSALLGLLLVAYAGISLIGFRLQISTQHERWAGPLLGAINGVLTGLTGSFVVPGVMFLQSIDLSREKLVQAMGLLFTVSTIALALSLGTNDFLSMQLGILSLIALIPALIGMAAGQRLRRVLSEQQFRRLFFLCLLVLGLYIIMRSGVTVV